MTSYIEMLIRIAKIEVEIEIEMIKFGDLQSYLAPSQP